jgi:hypothetical protein
MFILLSFKLCKIPCSYPAFIGRGVTCHSVKQKKNFHIVTDFIKISLLVFLLLKLITHVNFKNNPAMNVELHSLSV